ncbi:MAG: RecA protein [Gemmatimonadetes bacterium]|nr:RecA protein [Gemmatimonadota bacterium]
MAVVTKLTCLALSHTARLRYLFGSRCSSANPKPHTVHPLPSPALSALRKLLPVTAPPLPTLPTGVAGLDGTLLGGGLPRGRMTEVIGLRGSGKTGLIVHIATATVERGEWVAWIDATRTLSPQLFATLEGREELWVIRPRDARRAAWCADILLRSGAFGLVVLDGAPSLPRAISVRLSRLARESGAALLLTADGDARATRLGGSARLIVRRAGAQERRGWGAGEGEAGAQEIRGWGGGERRHQERPPQFPQLLMSRVPEPPLFSVAIEKGGTTPRPVEVSRAVAVARRLCSHSEVPDRRGVEKREARSGRGRRRATAVAPVGATAGARELGGTGAGEQRPKFPQLPSSRAPEPRRPLRGRLAPLG